MKVQLLKNSDSVKIVLGIYNMNQPGCSIETASNIQVKGVLAWFTGCSLPSNNGYFSIKRPRVQLFSHETGCLCSQNMELKCSRISGELLVLSLHLNSAEIGCNTGLSNRTHGLASDSETKYAKSKTVFYIFFIWTAIRRCDPDLGQAFLLHII